MHDAPLEAHEQTEHAVHAPDRFVARAAILVSALAVLAAVSGNLESLEASQALATSSEATLRQDEATDAWGEYEADSLKRHLYTLAQDLNPAQKQKYAETAKENADKQAAIRAKAKAAEATRTQLEAESREHENRHHGLTGAATLFEIAISLATVSIITRKNWLWQSGVALGIGGLILLAAAYL